MVSIVAVRPDDSFEAARPERGVTIRVRCAWENTAQGLLRAPIAELVKLSIDGSAVAPVLVSPKSARGPLLSDHYHYVHLEDLASGLHSVEAVVRMIDSKAEIRRKIQFAV